MTHKSSSNSDKHPYLKLAFWNGNTFWHDPKRRFSEAAKDYYDDWLQNLNQRERKLSNLIQK